MLFQDDRSRRLLRGLCLAVAVATASVWTLTPGSASAEIRSIVREMIANLDAIDQVGRGVALDDYEQVADAAENLRNRSEELMKWDLAPLGLDPQRDSQFDGYLAVQVAAAKSIAQAAKSRSGQAAMAALQDMFQNACLACHADFREGARLLRPSALFMTSFLNAWQDTNRGLATNDFNLVARSARDLEAMIRILAWDPVIEETFRIHDPEKRRDFRELLRKVSRSAGRMERAADDEDRVGVLEAVGTMWADGCIACHSRFR